MGRIITPTYRVEYTDNDSVRSYSKTMCWDTKVHGRPNTSSLEVWRSMYNTSFAPGGVNSHCTTKGGGIVRISNCRIVRQSTGKIVAEFIAPMFEVS